MVNEKGQPKKYKNKKWDTAQIFISEAFRPAWDKLIELCLKDNNEDFLKYCQEVEDVTVSDRKSGRRNIYIRWILFKHMESNFNKL